MRFGRFYARRARRLLPAAAVNLVVTAVVFAAIAAPIELAEAERGIRAAALYVANWQFISQSADYFATDVEVSPVAHYWSLSVEEQFYLLWPLALAGLFAPAGRLGRADPVLRAVVAAPGWPRSPPPWCCPGDLDRAYYGTDTRAYQLLAGAALALTPAVARLRASRVAPALGGGGPGRRAGPGHHRPLAVADHPGHRRRHRLGRPPRGPRG